MREAERCPHLEPSPGPGPPGCGLVRALTGLTDPGSCRVGPDACAACCLGPVPTARRVNPVVASLLSKAAAGVVASGGQPGCTDGKAADLRDWARRQIKVAFPEDEELPPSALPEPRGRCCHLGAEVDPRGLRFACGHPGHATTTPDGCHHCRDWSDRPRPEPVPLTELLPPPASRSGPPVRSWAVGVRTAPRRVPTRDRSLDSLIRAGWTEPRLFADSAVNVATRSAHLPVTLRSGRVGAWPNFYLGLAELLMREPEADAYLMAEDDVLYYDRQDLRGYLERVLWPGEIPGLVSLYCPSNYDLPGAGWRRHEGPWTLGALAFVFPAELARRFVTDPLVLEHRWTGPAEGLAGVGGAVGTWADRNQIPVYYPCPSLAQHIGDRSTLWPANRSEPHRRAARFLGDPDLT